MKDDLSGLELDASGLLAAATGAVRARRLAEVRDLEVLAQWAAVHSGDPAHPREALVQLGGEGTPRVQEFCLGEIALARGTGVTATTNATADVLDLIYRLPATWAICRAGRRSSRSPGGSPSCPGTCPPTGSGWWIGRWRG